ncbi:hypothetical protein EJF36_03285 [Bacillus sp. HMF5848]|uniref:hypothetical protein n=1 Tax=Bacillus sp. HMF5848 TaxID=2495421 RepID=UPI000F76A30D|nr:hypothetical protein [Bacillus sp. HMF5848]RSK25999.1 hypothetical protein EJF36_03285 [Bacillus sp. HMF5848]
MNNIQKLFIICIFTIIVVGCSNDKSDLVEVKGDGLTYSEYFKNVDNLDERDNITYFKPVSLSVLDGILPPSMKNLFQALNTEQVPFEVHKESVFLVKSGTANETQHQLQISYLDDNSDEFLIISVTESRDNPLDKYDFSNEHVDTVGNELRKELLVDKMPMFHQVLSTNSALLYQYYGYDESKNRIITIGTAANEIYTYYNGFVYHVGYSFKGDNDELQRDMMITLTRDFILGGRSSQGTSYK